MCRGDDDCEGGCDETFTCCRGATESCTTTCGTTGMRVCGASCGWSVCAAPAETCNGVDDDCNGAIDDGVLVTFYRDLDGDGFGVATDTTQACSAPSGYAVLPGDCNDTLAGINPGQDDGPTSACDSVDNDCDTTVDEGCDCVEGATERCGPVDATGTPLTAGICRQGTQTCVGGMWGICVGAVDPTTETCNELDDDCDGTPDEMLRVSCHRDGDDDSYALAGTAATSVCRDATRTGRGECPVGYTNRAPSTAAARDCNDGSAAQNPGAPALCANGVDENCSGSADEGCLCTTCACSGVSRYAPQVELRVTDRMPYVDYGGYRFGWVPPDAMDRARVSIACASNPSRVYAASRILYPSLNAPLIIAENNHEMYTEVVSSNGTGTTFLVSVVRQ